jgi:hypothetical protein
MYTVQSGASKLKWPHKYHVDTGVSALLVPKVAVHPPELALNIDPSLVRRKVAYGVVPVASLMVLLPALLGNDHAPSGKPGGLQTANAATAQLASIHHASKGAHKTSNNTASHIASRLKPSATTTSGSSIPSAGSITTTTIGSTSPVSTVVGGMGGGDTGTLSGTGSTLPTDPTAPLPSTPTAPQLDPVTATVQTPISQTSATVTPSTSSPSVQTSTTAGPVSLSVGL